jgi:hypothetical protein
VAVSFADARTVEFEVDFLGGDGPADIEITLMGVPTEQGLRLLHERLVSDPRFRHGLMSIVDMAELDTSGLSEGEIEQITKPIVARDWDYPPAAVAIIAPDSPSHNFVRSYRAHLGGSRSNRHLFTSRTDAVAWLETRATITRTRSTDLAL